MDEEFVGRFRTLGELKEWAAKELELWRPVGDDVESELQVIRDLKGIPDEPISEAVRNEVIAGLHRLRKKWVPSDSLDGQFILGRPSRGAQQGAYDYLVRGRVHLPEADHARGVIESVLFQNGIEGLTDAAKASTAAYLARLERDTEESRAAAHEAREQLRRATQQVTDAAIRLDNQARDAMNKATSSLEQTEVALLEKVRLKAPIKYWADKRKEHRIAAWAWLAAVVVVGGTAMGGAVFFAVLMLGPIVENATGDTVEAATPSFSAAVATAVVLGIALWILRLLTKNWMSNVHLAEDARERVAMIQSFLAIMADEGAKLNADDRAVMLSSIFRPASDGIVKEDHGPNLALFEMLRK
jgi:hypothetical protein